MRVVLVDDEPLALKRLQRALRDIPDVSVVGEAADGDKALAMLRDLVPDVVILDIEMAGLSGMEVAASLAPDLRPEIIFVTAFDHYAAEAFAVEAVDYLLKPVDPDRLRQAMERASRRRAERFASRGPDGGASVLPFAETLNLPDRDGGRDIYQSKIVWIEAAKDYALIYTASRSHILRITMSELAAQLHPSILRVHRSAFVAASSIRRRIRTERGLFTLLLSDGTKVQVGPSHARGVRARLRILRPDLD